MAPGSVAPYDPLAFDFAALLQPPGRAHLFGTDQFGRDILSRTIAAAAIDLQIAAFATVGPLLIGTAVGLLVGYLGTITNPAPCPTHGSCGSDPLDGPGDLTNGEPTPADPGAGSGTESFTEAAQDLPSTPTPTRVDAGTGPIDGSNGLEWLLLGGSLVGLSGAAYGARRLIGRTA